jgi:carbohydrate diacid regulator
MILQQELFQKLVDKIIADIGYNINIIDEKGFIIASGSPERIGTFHEAGYEAATQEKRIDIDEDNEEQYVGVKAGINQPFYHNGKLTGVIGITGNSKEIHEFVKLVKSMIELMVEQELLKERMYYRQSNKSYFANLLLNIKSEEDKRTLRRWAAKLGYDLDTPRCMLVVSFDGKYAEHAYSDILQRVKLIEGHTKEDFSTMVGSDKLIILKQVPEEYDVRNILTFNQAMVRYGEGLIEAINKLGIKGVYVGIGSSYDQVADHVNGYNEGYFCVEKLRQSKGHQRVGSIYDFMLEYATSFLPKGFIEHFVKAYFLLLKEQEELLETLVMLSKNHMNLVETAKDLFVHRNTVVFRVNKIRELTGLDPSHRHNDRILCHMIAGYYHNHEQG